MRKILILILILNFCFASAQQLQFVNTYGYDYNKFKVRDLFGLPPDTFAVPSSLLNVPFIANKSGTIYTWNITTHVWDAFSGGSTYTASRGLNLSGTDFRLGGEIDSTVVLTVNNHSLKIDKTTSTTPFIFTTLDTVVPATGAGLPYAGFQSERTLSWPSYSATGYVVGSDFTLNWEIKDSSALSTQGGDFGVALKSNLHLHKMDGYTGRSVYLLGNGSSLGEGVGVNVNAATFTGTSTTSNYKYAKGFLIGTKSYLIIPARDTLENWVGFYNKGFHGGHVKNTYDYIGGFWGSLSATYVANPWSFVSFDTRSKNWFAGPTGMGDSVIHASSLLDISSTTKGVLMPRMTTAQRNAITGVAGLILFDTDSSSYFQYTGSAWQNLYNSGGAGGGSTSFIGLTDVPASYSGESLKAVRVNAGETALEFYTPMTGSSLATLTDVTITSPTKGQMIMYDSTSAKYINASANDQNKQVFSYWDDFSNGLTGSRFLSRVSGTGSAVIAATANLYTSAEKRPGAISLNTGTTAVGYGSVDMLSAPQNVVVFKASEYSGEVRHETSIQFDNIATAGEDYVFYSGINADGRSGAPANSIHFEYNRAVTGDFWVLVTTMSTNRAVVVTTTPVTEDTWTRLEVRLNADATAVTGFINGTEVVASSGTYPITTFIYNGYAATSTQPQAILRKTAGLTAYKVYIDYIGVSQTINGNR